MKNASISKKFQKFGLLVLLPIFASITPMYFDRWHRGILTAFVPTLIAVSIVYWLESQKIFSRLSPVFYFLATLMPTTFLLWSKQAAFLQFVWSGLLVLVFTGQMRWYRIIAINVAVTVILFSVYEYAIREMDVGRRPPGNWTLAPEDSRAKSDKASAIGNRKFIRSFRKKQRPTCAFEVANEADLLAIKDCEDEFVTVRDGRRVTVGGPPNPVGRILMFGGSTLFCGDVADEFTISSLLQASVNSRGLNYEVLNFGLPGARAIHQLAKLQTIDLKPSDIVVFYDGGNDAWKVYEDMRDSHAARTPRRQVRELLETIETGSKVLFNAFLSDRLMYIDRDSIISESKKQIGDVWLAPVDAAQSLTRAKGARFIHVLQPNLFTYAHSGARGSMGDDIAAVYTAFQDEVFGRKEFDFTEIFDSSEVSPYLDWIHLVANGNQTVAIELAQIIGN